MSFASLPFKDRYEQMGDMSEGQFQAFALANDIHAVDFGLKRPKFKWQMNLPLVIRGMPDYICENERKEKFFVECKGTGGQYLKLKVENLEAIDHWNSQLTVWLFIYDSKNHKAWFQSYREIRELCEGSRLLRFPDNNKHYYNVLVSKLSREVTLPTTKENLDGKDNQDDISTN